MIPAVARTHSRASWVSPSVPSRVAAVAVAGTAVVAGFAAAGWDAAGDALRTADGELTDLLRMMALLKLAMVAGAAWLVDWRLRQPVGPRVAVAYLIALGLMAVGPGLIWTLTHLVLGAVLLHGGFALLVALAWRDEDFRFRRLALFRRLDEPE